jgi:hypothetical protein
VNLSNPGALEYLILEKTPTVVPSKSIGICPVAGASIVFAFASLIAE